MSQKLGNNPRYSNMGQNMQEGGGRVGYFLVQLLEL